MIIDERYRKDITRVLKEMEKWKLIAKASSILDGSFYEQKKSSGFWGFMKWVFTGDDDEIVDQMIEEAKEFYFLPILLNQTTNSILKYLN